LGKHDLKKQTQFLQGKMGVSIYMTGSCEILCDFGRRKNKANFIRSSFCVQGTAWCVLRHGFVIPVKTGIQTY
jgi:hypothetical protein